MGHQDTGEVVIPPTELQRGATINGRYLRFADVLRWAERTEVEHGVDLGSQEANDAALLVGYLLHRAAIDLCGQGGVVVSQQTNMWSRDGRNEDIEVTVGRLAPPSTCATWTDCRSYWLYRRASELEPGVEALDLYRRFRKAEGELYTENVEVAYSKAGGGAGVEIKKFWIAYPPHIAGYADEDYRINHATGSGRTKTAALLAAVSEKRS